MSEEAGRRPRCGDAGGRTAAGDSCPVFLGLSERNGLCLFHDPDRREEARELQAAGGRATAEKAAQEAERARERRLARPFGVPRAPKTYKDIARWESWLVVAVIDGDVTERQAEAVVKALRELRLTLDKKNLADRVRDLERQLKRAERSS